jgi:hypothetical protein
MSAWICLLIANLWLMLGVSTPHRTTGMIAFVAAPSYLLLALGIAGVL